MKLRGYQGSTIERARAERRKGHRRILIASPTGSGKTVMAVAMILRALELGARVLVIAHRKELIDQFHSQLARHTVDAGVMRADDERTDATRSVQLGTIQTLGRRDLPDADIVFVDEAHRAPGDSYARVLARYPKATIFGLTATPCRLDGRPLKEHFDVLVEGAKYSELIDEGAILAPIVYGAKRPPSLEKLKKSAGDYELSALEMVMMGTHVIGDVVSHWLQRALVSEEVPGKPVYLRTVVFAVGIDHSKKLCERFREAGARAAHLDGTTPQDERERILLDLELGRLDVVCNVGVLCEGWDQPAVKCCVMARPTLSMTLWMQCAGRILRPWCPECGGKCERKGQPGHAMRQPVVLDHSCNVDRHGLPHEDREWSLDGKAKRVSEVQARLCPGCYAYVEQFPCPLCGYAGEAAKPRTVKTADGVLERIDANIGKEKSRQAKVESGDPKRQFFDAQAERARKAGFKPGFAAAKYKEKFGDQWPPWAWSQSLKREYDSDPEWQGRVDKRGREREYWQDRAKAAEQTAGDATAYEPESSGIDDI